MLFQKLKHKSRDELIFRARTLLAKRMEKLFFRPNGHVRKLRQIPIPANVEAFLNHPDRKQFFFFPEREACRQIYRQQLRDDFMASIQRAEQFLDHQFNMLGAQFTFAEKQIPWQVNPATGKAYEQAFYQDISIFVDDGVTDIKHVWEINRHQFFIEVAKAYFLTGEEKYARQVLDWFEDWVAKNPYKIGVNWTSALEVAVRSYAWIWSFYFLLDSPLINSAVLGKFLQNLYLHGRYIRENLSFYFSPYNHLIGEVSALFTIGYLFPELPGADEWQRTGWGILTREMRKQFHDDGVTVEQATFYHHFTLGFYLMPVILRLQNGDPVPEQVMAHLKRILEFNLYFTKPDGTFPWVGDIDNARSIYFREPEQWDFRNILAIGALLFRWPALKFVAGQHWEEVLWLFGARGWQQYQQLEEKAPPRKRAVFPKSGYAVARSDWKPSAHYCWMDFGKIADGLFADDTPSAAHGQADLLHLEITAWGKNFIVDSGFHNYRGNFEWHRHFRLTRAHNTIEIDGQSQAKHGNRMMLWSLCPQGRLIYQIDRPGLFYLRATHNGFERLAGRPRHIRNFFFVSDAYWVIWDEIEGQGQHRVDSFLHFNYDCQLTLNEQTIHCQFQNDHLFILSHGDLQEVDLQEGGTRPEEGWISPLYRHAQPAPQLRFSVTGPLPLHHCFCIFPITEVDKWLQREDGGGKLDSLAKTVDVHFAVQEELPFTENFIVIEESRKDQRWGWAFGREMDKYKIVTFERNGANEITIIQEDTFEGK